MVGVEHAAGQLAGEHGVEQLAGPTARAASAGRRPAAGPRRASFGYSASTTSASLGSSDRPSGGEDAAEEARRAGGEHPADGLRQRGVAEGDQGLQGLQADRLGLLGRERTGRRTAPASTGPIPSRAASSWAPRRSGESRASAEELRRGPGRSCSRKRPTPRLGQLPAPRSETADEALAGPARASCSASRSTSARDRRRGPRRARPGCGRRPCGSSFASAGAARPGRPRRRAGRTGSPWSGSSGCRFCQTIAGMSLSSPQWDRTSTSTGSGSSPVDLPGGDGDLELHVGRRVLRQCRRPGRGRRGSTRPSSPAARTPQAR